METANVIEFDAARMTDEDVGLINGYLAERGPALGLKSGAAWLLSEIFTVEGLRRLRAPEEAAMRYHRIPDDLPDGLLGEVMVLLSLLSYSQGITEPTGKFLDQLALNAVGHAYGRLIASQQKQEATDG